MKTKACLLQLFVSIAAVALLSSIAQAVPLLVDFSTRAGSQAGWETLGTATDAASAVGVYSGYTELASGDITVTASGLEFSRRSNNGGTDTNFPGTTLDAMYNDLLFRNDNGTTVNVTIAGLMAGTYEITTHHLIATPGPGTFILDAQDADSPSFGQSIGTFNQGTGDGSTFNPNVITFDVLSNGTDPIILRMTQGTPTSGGTTGGWFGYNGMEIAAVPEPSTFGLAAIGLLAIFGFARRKG